MIAGRRHARTTLAHARARWLERGRRMSIGGMTTVEPQPAGSEPAHKRRSPWLWVSVALAIIAVGLLAWGLKTQSDLDSARSDVDRLQAQVDQSAQDDGAARAAITTVIGALAAQIGATNADLAAAEQQIKSATDAGAQAAKDAGAAARDAIAAKGETARANAQAAKADAQQRVAESKAGAAAGCARAYVSALSGLNGGDVRDRAAAVVSQLKRITADCKDAFSAA
jgi:hypothetical protein